MQRENSADRELRTLAAAAADFTRRELVSGREESDHYPFGLFFLPVLQKAFTLNFFHITLPETCGGAGLGQQALCRLLEQICREDASPGGIIFTNAFAQELILAAGQQRLLEAYVAPASKVEDFILGYPVFRDPEEFAAPPDAIPHDEGFRLFGLIEYVTMGGIARYGLVPAQIRGQRDLSLFLIDLLDPALIKRDPALSLGLHACPSVDIRLNGVEATLVGEPGGLVTYFSSAANRLMVAAASMASGIMKGSLRDALEYAHRRRQGGQATTRWPQMQMILTQMAVKSRVIDMGVRWASRAVDEGRKEWEKCSRAIAIEALAAAVEVSSEGIQALGGAGYMKDFGQEKRFRDAQHIQCLLGLAPLKKTTFFRRFLTPPRQAL
jgi:alkylation response protein AidB-like acyl-CoA dehydrogenase